MARGGKFPGYVMAFIYLLSKILMAQGLPTGTSLESTGVSISDLQKKTVAGLDGECYVYMFCVDEVLSGKNMSIKEGTRDICDLSGDRSPCNFTCDEESEAFRVSDKCMALSTRCANKTFHLELGGKSTPPSYNKTCSNRENANKNVTPNPNDTTPGTNNAWHVWGNYVVPIIAVVVIIMVFAIGFLIIRCKKKRRSSERSLEEEEGVELNAVQVAESTPNGINGHAAQNGISSVVGV